MCYTEFIIVFSLISKPVFHITQITLTVNKIHFLFCSGVIWNNLISSTFFRVISLAFGQSYWPFVPVYSPHRWPIIQAASNGLMLMACSNQGNASNIEQAGDSFNTVQCRYNVVNFLTNIHKRHPIGVVCGVFCGFSISLIFYLIFCNHFCNILLYWTAL